MEVLWDGEDQARAEWRHWPESVKFNYLKPLTAQTIIFTAQTGTNVAQTNVFVIIFE